MAAKRVLSIQSHVVHGYVGNRCAVFPLQLLGYEVDFINSVQFSNHTGYPVTKGSIMDGEQLTEIVAGLRANGLLEYTHLVTGATAYYECLARCHAWSEDGRPVHAFLVMPDQHALCM